MCYLSAIISISLLNRKPWAWTTLIYAFRDFHFYTFTAANLARFYFCFYHTRKKQLKFYVAGYGFLAGHQLLCSFPWPWLLLVFLLQCQKVLPCLLYWVFFLYSPIEYHVFQIYVSGVFFLKKRYLLLFDFFLLFFVKVLWFRCY